MHGRGGGRLLPAQSLAKRAAGISRTFEDYFQLRILHQPILHSYVLALVLIGLVVVMLASWFGLYLARGITGPIKLLAEGTHAIAAGDLNYRNSNRWATTKSAIWSHRSTR